MSHATDNAKPLGRISVNQAQCARDFQNNVQCPTCGGYWWLNPPIKMHGTKKFLCINCKAIYTEEMLAALDMLTALKNVQKLIAEAAMTGFNYKDGDWPERLFASQHVTDTAIRRAEGRQLRSLSDVDGDDRHPVTGNVGAKT